MAEKPQGIMHADWERSAYARALNVVCLLQSDTHCEFLPTLQTGIDRARYPVIGRICDLHANGLTCQPVGPVGHGSQDAAASPRCSGCERVYFWAFCFFGEGRSCRIVARPCSSDRPDTSAHGRTRTVDICYRGAQTGWIDP